MYIIRGGALISVVHHAVRLNLGCVLEKVKMYKPFNV